MSDTTGRRDIDPNVDRDERVWALEEFERRLIQLKKVPDVERLPTRRFAFVVQVLMAIALGVVVGTGSIYLNFRVFSKLLHL